MKRGSCSGIRYQLVPARLTENLRSDKGPVNSSHRGGCTYGCVLMRVSVRHAGESSCRGKLMVSSVALMAGINDDPGRRGGDASSLTKGRPARDPAPFEPPLFDLRGTAKTYRTIHNKTVVAVSPVTLSLSQGEFVSIVGPSGCGKTTLLNMLTGLIGPSAGEIYFRGEPLHKPSTEVSLVFQRPVLLPWRRIIDNVLLPAEVMHLKPLQKYRERAEELLALLGLAGFEGAYPRELSGGMQQRASIARALLLDSKCLLMDEPFAALDAMTREELNLELLRIWTLTKRTIVFVTHNISEAVLLSDRIVVMTARPGKVREIIDVDIPRPRSLSLLGQPQFGLLVDQVRGLLERFAPPRGGGQINHGPMSASR